VPPNLPLLLLTARGDEDDRVRGLKSGADDYVVKPFSPREVVARVEALLRRANVRDVITLGPLVIGAQSRTVRLGDIDVPLSRTEFELLLTLARHPGIAFSRERLLERVWGPEFAGTERVVDVNIQMLRRKLGDDLEARVRDDNPRWEARGRTWAASRRFRRMRSKGMVVRSIRR